MLNLAAGEDDLIWLLVWSVELLWWHGMVEALEGKCWTGSVVAAAWLITWQYLLTWRWLGWWRVKVNYFSLRASVSLLPCLLKFVVAADSDGARERVSVILLGIDGARKGVMVSLLGGRSVAAWICCCCWGRQHYGPGQMKICCAACLCCGEPQISDGCDGFCGWLVDELL